VYVIKKNTGRPREVVSQLSIRMAAPLGACFLLSACAAVGPEFSRPNVELAHQFAFAPHQGLETAARAAWWQELNDPVLNQLLDKALHQNLDLERSRARIEAARALLGTVGPGAQLSGPVVADATARRVEGLGWQTSSAAEFRPSFIIDLFGGQRRSLEAAQARLASEEYGAAVLRLAVQLELVEAYLDLRFNDALLAERHRSTRNRAQVVDVVRARVAAGESLRVDLRRAEAALATSRARLPGVDAARKRAVLRIATLLAEPAQKVTSLLEHPSRGIPMPGVGVDPDLPAALLRNRPDIRQAEADLAAAVAEIGISEAQLYPNLRVEGNVRVSSANVVSLGPVLSVPILDRPVRKARLASARARAREAEVIWRQAVLEAVEDVQVALVRLNETNLQQVRLREAVIASRSANRLAEEAFQVGALTLSEILDAEEDVTSARVQLLNAQAAHARSWAQLNVAVGQGWYHGASPHEAVPDAPS
jgi:multidrug efflux system outer membrane protein